jgi:hypothetical protein
LTLQLGGDEVLIFIVENEARYMYVHVWHKTDFQSGFFFSQRCGDMYQLWNVCYRTQHRISPTTVPCLGKMMLSRTPSFALCANFL